MADHPDRPAKWRPDSDRRWICHVWTLWVGGPQGDRSQGEVDRASTWVSHRIWRGNLRAEHHVSTDAGRTGNQPGVHLPGAPVSVQDDLRAAWGHVGHSSFAVR